MKDPSLRARPDLFGGFSGTINLDHFDATGGENGDQPTRLQGSGLFHVAGHAVPCHIHLVAVTQDDELGQVAVDTDDEDYLDGLNMIDEGGAPRQTFHYKGRDYVIVLWPFG